MTTEDPARALERARARAEQAELDARRHAAAELSGDDSAGLAGITGSLITLRECPRGCCWARTRRYGRTETRSLWCWWL